MYEMSLNWLNLQANEDQIAGETVKKLFHEIVFHGLIGNENIAKILENHQENAAKITFAKNDLKFIKADQSEVTQWLGHFTESLVSLNTLNLEVAIDKSDARVTLENLKKLSCGDDFLSVVNAPNLVDLRVSSRDELSKRNLENINKFLERHHSIKKFSYIIYCGTDENVQNVDFDLAHLELTEFILTDFRYDPNVVLKILQNQKSLKKLRLEDGYFSSEDIIWARNFKPIFKEINTMKYLDKLVIEMPTIKFLRNLRDIKSLRRLQINAITSDDLEEFLKMAFPNLVKLALEGISFGKKPLTEANVWKLGENFKSLQCLKFDVAPVQIVDCLVRHLPQLKTVKIYHNKGIVKKIRLNQEENFKFSTTRLEKIICEIEDFKLRIMPILKASPNLLYLKIYWHLKTTPIMSVIFEILMECPRIREIEFKYNGVFAKDDAIPFKSSFNFSFNYRNYQLLICKKTGKIKCIIMQ